MPTVVSSVSVNKGEWTFLWETTAANQDGVIHCPLLPNTYPVPVLWVADAYPDVLNTNTLVIVSSILMAGQSQYFFRAPIGAGVWCYYENRAPLGDVIPVSVWLY